MKLGPWPVQLTLLGFFVFCSADSLICAPVTFDLGEVTAQPGQAEVSLPLSLDVGSEEYAVSGWLVIVRYDPAILGNVRLEETRGAQRAWPTDQAEFVEPGTVSLAVVYSLTQRVEITPANDGVVANLRFCVLETAAPGTYPIEFVVQADRKRYVGQVMYYVSTGDSLLPATQGGAVTVGGSPVAGSDCVADDHDTLPPPPPPPGVEAVFKLEGGSAFQGGSVTIPFIIQSAAEVQGFSFSVDFNEEALEVTSIERVFTKPDGSDWDLEILTFNNSNETPGNNGLDEGFLVGAGIFSYTERSSLLSGQANEVLAFHFRVKPDAPLGTTELRFVDGGRASHELPGTPNTITAGGRTLLPVFEASIVLIHGRLQIVPDISMFVRGDSNGDEKVDISDARFTLNYLFLGGRQPQCFDAGDANDDGKLDVSDPISTLQFLFLGGPPIPPPNGVPGTDPTPDSMGCLYRS